MKKISYILAGFSMLLFLAACKKEKNEESTWYIDGVKYSTRDLERTIAYDPPTNIYSIALQYDNNLEGLQYISIGLSFHGKTLPQTGSYPIKTNLDTNRNGLLEVYYKRHIYYCSNSNGIIIASSYKGLAKYEIAPVWFKSNNGDSILFSAILFEPLKKQ